MRIEFLGISGVGKTTIANKIVSDMEDNAINTVWPWKMVYKENWIIRNIKKGISVLFGGIRHIGWTGKLAKLLNSLNMNKRDAIKLFFNGVYLKESFSKCRADDNIRYIFDEGIIQYIYAIYLRKKTEPEEKIIIELAQLYGLPDYLYVIRATSKTIYSRLINRGRKTRILETDNLLEDIEKLQTIEQQIVSIILEKGLMDSEKISIYDNN